VSIDKRDWVLIVLATRDDQGHHPSRCDMLRLQLALFVIGKKLSPSPFFLFRSHHYGPFDTAIDECARELTDSGQLERIEEEGGRYVSYRASDAGLTAAATASSELSGEALAYVWTVRRWVLSHDFGSILSSIYERWPEMRKQPTTGFVPGYSF